MGRSQACAGVATPIPPVGGGGEAKPAPGAEGTLPDDLALGLSKAWYDTLLQLDVYLANSAHDKYTLGAKLSKGDPFDLPNPIMRAAQQGSFEPSDVETNRIVAAAAIVRALSLEETVEVSVSSEKADALPSDEDWDKMFAQL